MLSTRLLNEGRLATIQAWIDRARAKQIAGANPGGRLRRELALREGKHLSAESLAQAALSSSWREPGRDAWRAAMVAGRGRPLGDTRGICAWVLSLG